MDGEFAIEYKSVVDLKRMTQPQLIAYVQQLQEALFEITEANNE